MILFSIQCALAITQNEEYRTTAKDMIEKEIDKLPENMLIEAYNFVKLLETKKNKELLTKATQKMSEASFEKIWDQRRE